MRIVLTASARIVPNLLTDAEYLIWQDLVLQKQHFVFTWSSLTSFNARSLHASPLLALFGDFIPKTRSFLSLPALWVQYKLSNCEESSDETVQMILCQDSKHAHLRWLKGLGRCFISFYDQHIFNYMLREMYTGNR